MKLSVVLATRNEENNIGRCLESVKNIADEIIVVDEYSTDKTREIAEKLGAKVFLEPHHDIFHITKQKALDKATGDWILQMDADEVVTPKLALEIKEVLESTHQGCTNKLFIRHQKLIEQRDGPIGSRTGEIVGYFIPRRNFLMGKPIIHGGVYPDGVIRLVKNGKAHFPQISVHEQIQLNGEVAWLSGDLLHYDYPTLKQYLKLSNRYSDLMAKEIQEKKINKNAWTFFLYTTYKPLSTFVSLYFRHLAILDGAPGFVWSFYSASRFPIAYFKYLTDNNK
jgi:glycosyltransferase involved in cell wall biosynthesis